MNKTQVKVEERAGPQAKAEAKVKKRTGSGTTRLKDPVLLNLNLDLNLIFSYLPTANVSFLFRAQHASLCSVQTGLSLP